MEGLGVGRRGVGHTGVLGSGVKGSVYVDGGRWMSRLVDE